MIRLVVPPTTRLGRPDRQLDQLESTINRLDQFLSSEFVAGYPTPANEQTSGQEEGHTPG